MKKHAGRARTWPHFTVSLMWLAVGIAIASLASVSRAEDPAVVRLSYVHGDVTVKQPDASMVSHAVGNLPLFSGSSVVTGQDGEAEIEFSDGSVARLTPNSSLVLKHLQRLGNAGHSDLQLTSGLVYFELNVGQGQRFTLTLDHALARPMENSIFRVSLDKIPELAVMRGSLHLDAVGGGRDLDKDLTANQSARLDANDPSSSVIADEIAPDSWDQWNIDRDTAIAQQGQLQTPVRDSSQAPNDPGWNDLDAYGNWYPIDGYGDVWTPNNVDAGWDPFAYGYWGNFQGYGATWISGYPWGWLPYHCGAWNYFPFGWGWIPGGCGAGWSPLVTVWNTPPNYRLPAWPKGGFIVPSQHRPPLGGQLIPVDRRPGSPLTGINRKAGSTGSTILLNRGMRAPAPSSSADHEQVIELDGKTIKPVAAAPTPGVGFGESNVAGGSTHVGVPVSRSTLLGMGNAAGDRILAGPGRPIGSAGAGNSVELPSARPAYTAPARVAPAAPVRSAPAPAPASHVAAPPPAAGRPH